MFKNVFVALVAVVTLAGCYKQATLNPNAMTYEESQSVVSIKRGVIIAVEQAQVTIEGSDEVAAVSGIAGGLLGSQIGQGVGRDVGIFVGALAGGIAGKAATQKEELSFVYTVELQNRGGLIQVTQTGSMLPQKAKVLVRKYSNGRSSLMLDQSQGVTFSTAKETSYEEDAEEQAKKDYEKLKREMEMKAAAEKQTKRDDAAYALEMEAMRLELEEKRAKIDAIKNGEKAKVSVQYTN